MNPTTPLPPETIEELRTVVNGWRKQLGDDLSGLTHPVNLAVLAALLNERDSLLESMAELRAAKLNEMAEKMDQSVMKGALEAQALTRTVMAERDSLVAENERLRGDVLLADEGCDCRACKRLRGRQRRYLREAIDAVMKTNGGEDERE
jgi:hypothetical protein